MAGLVRSGVQKMTQHPLPEDLIRVTDAITLYQGPTITGAALGVLVRRAAPNLNLRAAANLPIGTGALAKFVGEHLSHLLRKAGQTASDGTGGDIVYQVLRPQGTSAEQTQEGTRSVAHDFWNAFVRPSDKRVLLILPSEDGPKLHLADGTDHVDGKLLEKVSLEEFRSISDEFLRMLKSNPSTEGLATRLQGVNTYATFVQTLKAEGNAYFMRWAEHRRERLRSLFINRLESAGYTLPDQQRLLSFLDRSQITARNDYKSRLFSPTTENPRITLQVRQNTLTATQDARELLKAVVDRMSMQEIRALSVPIGYLLDAMQETRAKANKS